jgi:formate/nitrite transporter FocA (FNT family)
MAFIEHRLAGDPTNWWAPNHAGVLAMLRSAGLEVTDTPGHEIYICRPGLSAGMDVSFSLLLMAVMITLGEGQLPAPVVEILVANMYAAGYVFVILGRSELFTEHTTLAVLPVLDGKASLRQLGRLWGVIYGANLVGTSAFAAMIVFVAPALGIAEPWAFGKIAHGLVDKPSWVILWSARCSPAG